MLLAALITLREVAGRELLRPSIRLAVSAVMLLREVSGRTSEPPLRAVVARREKDVTGRRMGVPRRLEVARLLGPLAFLDKFSSNDAEALTPSGAFAAAAGEPPLSLMSDMSLPDRGRCDPAEARESTERLEAARRERTRPNGFGLIPLTPMSCRSRSSA